MTRRRSPVRSGHRRPRCSRRCSSASSSRKARLQGRRGPARCSPTASCAGSGARAASTVEGTTVVYRLAPPSSRQRSELRSCSCRSPARAPGLGVGHDALVLAGLLALARFAIAAALGHSNGFALMGASRDLTLAVFVEAALVLALAVAALVAGTTDLRGMVAGTAGGGVWSKPALGLGARRVRARRRRRDRAPAGRQPRHPPRADDDPRGAAARVRGPRPGLLQWAAAARHWLVLVLAAQSSCPTPQRLVAARGPPGRARRALRAALARDRDARAKMRILLVPRLLARRRGRRAARGRHLAGRLARERRRSSGRSSALGIGVVVVRRRSRRCRRSSRRRRCCSPPPRSATAARPTAPRPRALVVRARRARRAAARSSSAHARAAAGARRRRAARARGGLRSAFALALTWLVPPLGLDIARRRARRAGARRVRPRDGGDAARRRSSRCSGSCSPRTGSRSPRSRFPAAPRSRSSSASRSTCPGRARRRRLPRADPRRVRRRRHRRAAEPA